MRSAMPLRPRRARPASRVKPSCAANRAARSIRSGSSPNDTSGALGRAQGAGEQVVDAAGRIDSTLASGRRSAIALTVKSRRARSASRLSPNATTGLRVAPS